MDYYSALKQNEILTPAYNTDEPEDIVFSEITQAKRINIMIPLKRGTKSSSIHRNKTEWEGGKGKPV